jgi:hypothetical protein
MPTLTYAPDGIWFNNVWYGSDEEAAKKARDEYYSPDDLKDVL